MTRALTDAELTALDRAAAVGFHRDPPPVPDVLRRAGDDAPGLTLLAYAAHQRRLTTLPPRAPATVERIVAPADPRPVLPDRARLGLRRLVQAAVRRRATAVLAPIAWALRDRGWRPHPFDTEALGHLDAAAGPYERWLAGLAGVELGGDAPVADVGDAAWTTLPPAQRVAWLRNRRRSDPDAARELLVAAFPGEKAEVRQRLLGALEVRLGPADAAFLESLVKDRSAGVRERALALFGVASVTRPALGFETQIAAKIRAGDVDGHARLAAAAVAAGGSPVAGRWQAELADLPVATRRALLEPLLDGPLLPVIAASLGAPQAWIDLLEGPLPHAASERLRATPAWKALLAALPEAVDTAPENALLAVAPLVPGDDARAAVAELDAVGSRAAPLVRMTWTLLADLEGAP